MSPVPLASIRYPLVSRGIRIGLMGGTFDPAHVGHVYLARVALARGGVDRVWWLLAPLNPLKLHVPPTRNFPQRLADARRVAACDSRIRVTGLETKLASDHTARTVRLIRRRWPRGRFVWIMGADSFASLLDWRSLRPLIDSISFLVFARHGVAPYGRAMARFARYRKRSARRLAAKAPAWSYVRGPLRNVSSTELRRARATSAIHPSLAAQGAGLLEQQT